MASAELWEHCDRINNKINMGKHIKISFTVYTQMLSTCSTEMNFKQPKDLQECR